MSLSKLYNITNSQYCFHIDFSYFASFQIALFKVQYIFLFNCCFRFNHSIIWYEKSICKVKLVRKQNLRAREILFCLHATARIKEKTFFIVYIHVGKCFCMCGKKCLMKVISLCISFITITSAYIEYIFTYFKLKMRKENE